MTTKRNPTWYFFAILLPVILVFGQYYQTLSFGYNLDDEFVTNNHQVQQGVSAIPEIFTSRYFEDAYYSFGYRPVAEATFAIEYSLFGANPQVSHFINLLLYALIGMLLFQVVKRLSGQTLWAGITMVFFLAMPVHSEVVVSLKNREELLVGLIALASFWVYLHKPNMASWKVWTSLGFLFVLGILTKLTAIVIPPVVFLYWFFVEEKKPIAIESKKGKPKFDLLFWLVIGVTHLGSWLFIHYTDFGFKILVHLLLLNLQLAVAYFKSGTLKEAWQSTSIKSYVLLGAPLFAISIFFPYHITDQLIVTSFLLSFSVALGWTLLSSYGIRIALNKKLLIPLLSVYGGGMLLLLLRFKWQESYFGAEIGNTSIAHNPLYHQHEWIPQLKLFFLSTLKYAELLFFPQKLLFFYGYNTLPIPDNWFDIHLLAGAFIVIASLSIGAFLLYQKQQLLAWSWSFFLLGLIPFVNLFVPVAGIIGERLVFFSSIGLAIFIGGVFSKTLSRWRTTQNRSTNSLILVFTILCLPYFAFSWYRSKDWKDPFTLYQADIRHLQNSARANAIYADALYQQLGANASRKEIEKVISHFERSVAIDSSFFNGWNNLGVLYSSLPEGQEEAKQAFKACLRLRSDYFDAHYNLGILFEEEGNMKKAIFHYRKAVEAQPQDLESLQSLANGYYQTKQMDSAYFFYQALEGKIAPNPTFQQNLASLALLNGDTALAIKHLENAITLQPNAEIELFKKELEESYENEN